MTDETNSDQQEQIQLERQADPRIRAIAAEAHDRGWKVRWTDDEHSTQLQVFPAVSNPEQQDNLAFTVGVRLGGQWLICFAWEAWTGTLIDPWEEDGKEHPASRGDDLFTVVVNLENCCRVFDRGVNRYLPCMRRCLLEMGETDQGATWADIEPIANPIA